MAEAGRTQPAPRIGASAILSYVGGLITPAPRLVGFAISEGRRARIDVTDTGRGIAAEDISKVFEPYYSTKETGTGLGLAIVKKAVDDHEGTISVKSKVGEGTTFTITLPTMPQR